MNGIKLRKTTVVLDDRDTFNNLCEFGVFSEKGNEITINAKYLMKYIADDDRNTWRSRCEEQVTKLNTLQEKLKFIEEKDKEISSLSGDIKAIKQQNGDLKNENQKLCSNIKDLETVLKEKDSGISSLKKQIEDLQTVRGIVDKFGTYKSLQKTLEVLEYIRGQVEENGSVRWIEIIKHFKQYHWKQITTEYHLRRLREQKIIMEKRDVKGEYIINEEELGKKGIDFDCMVEWIVGSRIYDLAKESWLENQQS